MNNQNQKYIGFSLNTLMGNHLDPVLTSYAQVLLKSMVSIGIPTSVISDRPVSEVKSQLKEMGLSEYVSHYSQDYQELKAVVNDVSVTILFGLNLHNTLDYLDELCLKKD